MNNEIVKKLLESKNKEDQLIALNLIISNPDINLDFIPYDKEGHSLYLRNYTDKYGYIMAGETILLFGTATFRRIPTKENLNSIYHDYRQLNKNLEPHGY